MWTLRRRIGVPRSFDMVLTGMGWRRIWRIMHRPWWWSILIVVDVTFPVMLRMLNMVSGISVRIIVEASELGPGEPVQSLLAHDFPDEDAVVG